MLFLRVTQRFGSGTWCSVNVAYGVSLRGWDVFDSGPLTKQVWASTHDEVEEHCVQTKDTSTMSFAGSKGLKAD